MSIKKTSANYYVALPENIDLNVFLPQPAKGVFKPDEIHPLSIAIPIVPNPSLKQIGGNGARKMKITITLEE